ncbi:MAG: DNRLRE domain-containing protein, partial [Candidatus Hadarchaeum sp.]
DTYLDEWDQTVAKGGDIDLRLITNGVRRPLIKFEFSPYLPFGARVVSARLYLWAWYASNSLSIDVAVYRVNRHWEESTATWRIPWMSWGCNQVPGDREGVAVTTKGVGALSPSGEWLWLDITTPVQEWVSGRSANEGVILISWNEARRDITFRSSDFYNANQHPYVEVLYYDPVPTPTPTNTATPTRTPTPTVTLTPTPLPGRFEGTVWNDRNGNGIRDGEEPGLAGAVVRLYDVAYPDPYPPLREPFVTAGDGVYYFAELPPGTYLLTVDVPPNYVPTTRERMTVLVPSGRTVQVNFGAWIPATATPTASPSPTPTWTATPSPTFTWTATPSATSTLSATPSPTPSRTTTLSPTITPSSTPTLTRMYRLFLPIIIINYGS